MESVEKFNQDDVVRDNLLDQILQAEEEDRSQKINVSLKSNTDLSTNNVVIPQHSYVLWNNKGGVGMLIIYIITYYF